MLVKVAVYEDLKFSFQARGEKYDKKRQDGYEYEKGGEDVVKWDVKVPYAVGDQSGRYQVKPDYYDRKGIVYDIP